MRRIAAIVIAVIVVALLAWRAADVLRARQAAAPQQGPRQPRSTLVQTAPARRATLEVRATLAGEVVPLSRVDVSARISGVVLALAAQEGDLVRQGQVLARLDPKELRFQVEQARAGVRTQQVQVEQARATVEIQRARLAQTLAGTASEQVRQAEEQVRQARASLEYSRGQLARVEDLHAQGFVSRQAVDAARLDVTLQEARVRSAEDQLSLLERGPRPEEVQVARAQLAQAETAERQARSVLAQSRVTLSQSESLLAESTVRAPMSGVVGRRGVDVGATVGPAVVIFQIVQVDPAVVTVTVAERDLERIRPGMPAAVRVESLPGRAFQGRVSAVSPVLDAATRSAAVKIAVPNAGTDLRPGMSAVAEVVLARREAVVTVPVDAVLQRDGESVVFVAVDGTARLRRVVPGVATDAAVEITRGVVAGEAIIVAGQHTLRDGARVIVAEARGRAGPPGTPRRPGGAPRAPGGSPP